MTAGLYSSSVNSPGNTGFQRSEITEPHNGYLRIICESRFVLPRETDAPRQPVCRGACAMPL